MSEDLLVQERARPLAPAAAAEPRWARAALVGLLALSAVLYLVGLSASGWANSFYSAAVQAGATSWKAFFYGSSDAANFITVDKPPASLWVMDLSVRVFGLNSWAVLVPQALMGVAAVGVVHAAVRRGFGAVAGLVAGLVLAVTPVAVLMFRYNNPDALLALLLALALYAVVRAQQDGRTRWLVLAGALVGFAFLTKSLQAFLVLPAMAGVYLGCGPGRFRRRVAQLGAGLAALVVAGGWWVAVVELTPAGSRPYIGGSTDNSFLQLTFGYNGFGRLTGNETGSVGGGSWGSTGLSRMFGSEFGGGIAWLLPAALVLAVSGVWLRRRAERTDAVRAGFLLMGGALVTTWLCLSLMQGIVHPYYTVAMAPSLAAVIGMGVRELWRGRERRPVAALGGALIAGTGVWAFVLLDRTPGFLPWLRWVVAVAAIAAGARWALQRQVGRARLAAVTGLAGVVAALAGPTAYAVDTAATAHTGSIVSAGPSAQGGFGGGPGGGGGARGGMRGAPGGGFPAAHRPTGVPGGGAFTGGLPGGGMHRPGANTPGGRGGPGGGGGGGGGFGGLLNGAAVSGSMKTLLEQDASRYTWVAATVGSQNAASYQLATQRPVMAVGGFNGTDAAPTLEQFKAYVSAGRIRYFIPGQSGSTTADATQITAWVKAHFSAKSVGGTTVYDLTSAKN